MLSMANVKNNNDFCAKIFIPGSYKFLSILALPDKLKGGSPYMGISPASPVHQRCTGSLRKNVSKDVSLVVRER